MRPVLFAATTIFLASLATAQCHDVNFGALVGFGDDGPLQTIRPLGITFPFAGSNYTSVHINNNGMIYLSNAGVPGPGTATGYSSSAATLSANLRSGAQAKISAFWSDLNNLAPNGGGVKIDNTLGNRCVITWDNTVEFGQTVQKDIQIVLWDTGVIEFAYNAGCAVQVGAALVGCGVGGAVEPGQSDLSGAFSTAVPTVYQVFTPAGATAFDLGGRGIRFAPNGGGGFDVSTFCQPAAHQSLSVGCGGSARAFYESVIGPTQVDLTGSTMTAVENGNGGYDVSIAPISTYVVPAGVGLALGDDVVSASQALGFTWDYPGGSTGNIVIDSNGRILLNGTDGTDFSPTVAELLSDTVHQIGIPNNDFTPDGATNLNNVYFETDGVGEARITWQGVTCFNSLNPNFVQVVLLHTAAPGGDSFEVRYQAIFNDSTFNDDAVIGFATGPGALNPGNRDLSAAAPFSTSVDLPNLSVSAAPTPVLGANVVFTTNNMPATTALGVNVLGLVSAGGVELLPGAPGCFSWVALTGNELVYGLFVFPTDTNVVTIPNDPFFIGVEYLDQTVAFVPGINAYQMITSNGIKGTINSF